jgi:hypothetical protein
MALADAALVVVPIGSAVELAEAAVLAQAQFGFKLLDPAGHRLDARLQVRNILRRPAINDVDTALNCPVAKQ